MTAVARPTKPFAQLRGERSWYVTAGEYIALGFHHIMQGVDHLLFVLVTLTSAVVVSLKKPWTRIVIRVTGSWICASGLLMIGWLIRGAK